MRNHPDEHSWNVVIFRVERRCGIAIEVLTLDGELNRTLRFRRLAFAVTELAEERVGVTSFPSRFREIGTN